MIQIRRGVFETNSSSTHSITMCLESDYDRWRRGEVFFKDDAKNPFITKEEAIRLVWEDSKWSPDKKYEDMDEEEFLEALRENDIYTYNNYWSEYMETYSDSFTTPAGEKVIAFGQYGYDG